MELIANKIKEYIHSITYINHYRDDFFIVFPSPVEYVMEWKQGDYMVNYTDDISSKLWLIEFTLSKYGYRINMDKVAFSHSYE